MEQHIATEHDLILKHECRLCGFANACKEQLERHIVENHSFPCEKCPIIFQDQTLLLRHFKNYHVEKAFETMIKCTKCGESFVRTVDLKNHNCNENNVKQD